MINVINAPKTVINAGNKLRITYNPLSEYSINEDDLTCLQEFIVKIIQIGLGEEGLYDAASGGC